MSEHLTIRELTFIRKQLLEENPNLPELFGVVTLTEMIRQFVDHGIHKAIAYISQLEVGLHDIHLIKEDTFKDFMNKGRIREIIDPHEKYELDYCALVYYPSYIMRRVMSINHKKIRFVNWAYKAVVTEIMNYIKAVNTIGNAH